MRAGIRFAWRIACELRLSHTIAIGAISLTLISCAYPARQPRGIDNYPGWPLAREAQGRPNVERHATTKIVRPQRVVTKKAVVPREKLIRPVSHPPLKGPFPAVKADLPAIAGAEYIREDELCMTCHETHVTLFKEKNVHRSFSCEECHGPASEHLLSRGQDEGKILNVRRLEPAQRSEICLRCHETEKVIPPHVAEWRTSIHANKDLACSDCHTAHHDLPRGTPAVTPAENRVLPPDFEERVRRRIASNRDAQVVPAVATVPVLASARPVGARLSQEPGNPPLPSLHGTSKALLAESPETCYRCHDGSHRLTELVGPHLPGSDPKLTCTTCHDAHGDITVGTLRDSCVKCHDSQLSPTWHTATHNEAGLYCADCHDQHPTISEEASARLKEGNLVGLPRPMEVTQATACVRCHEETKLIVAVADPHQIDGPNHMQCSTCHDPHGKVLDTTRKELCLTCHTEDLTPAWHTATHNEAGLVCTDCHNPHPALGAEGLVNLEKRDLAAVPRPMAVVQTKACVSCHQDTKLMIAAPGPHQVGGPGKLQCTSCHDPHGKVLDSTGKDMCLICHKGELSATWHSSMHNEAGLRCSDCHNPHPKLGPQGLANLEHGNLAGLPRPMVSSQVEGCVRCHEKTRQLLEIADPHQVGGPNRFVCTTCHDPHGKVKEETRQELCLTCHTGTPTAAWHSSLHNLQGIHCTDCHDPHPDSHVQPNIDIRHTNIRRPRRLPMSVNDPDTCYKCHPQIYGRSLMPSHHPIFEGKMVCSSCHDSHGQAERLLTEPQLNLVCYKCHSEVQGPFVYEHPPVTQDCSICHEPHGTVENNLLRQPTTFLCLRCHSGHRNGPPFHDQALLPDIGTSRPLQKAFYTDCTQCHSQVHGSDVPSPNQAHTLAR